MNSTSKLKILLDSTYILPILGVEVEGLNDVLKSLAKLSKGGKAVFYYTPFNILEILGKIVKTEFDRETVAKGLSIISEEFIQTFPTVNGYLKALELRKQGFGDLIDLLLYVTALTRDLKFLTRDRELIMFLEREQEKIDNILPETELLKYIKTLK